MVTEQESTQETAPRKTTVKERLLSKEWAEKPALERAKERRAVFAASLNENPEIKSKFNAANAETQKAIYSKWIEQSEQSIPNAFKATGYTFLKDRSGNLTTVQSAMPILDEQTEHLLAETNPKSLDGATKFKNIEKALEGKPDMQKQFKLLHVARYGTSSPAEIPNELIAEEPSLLDKAKQYTPAALRTIGPMAGGAIAAVAGQLGPQILTPEEIYTVPAGSAAGAAAVEPTAQWLEKKLGVRDKYSIAQGLFNTAFATISPVKSGNMGQVGTAALRTAEGGVLGGGQNIIDQLFFKDGKFSFDELNESIAIGSAVGLGFHGLTELPSAVKSNLVGKTKDEVKVALLNIIGGADEKLKKQLEPLIETKAPATTEPKQLGKPLDTSAPEGSTPPIDADQSKADAIRYEQIDAETQQVANQLKEVAATKGMDSPEMKALEDKAFELATEREAIKNRNPESIGMPPGKISADDVPPAVEKIISNAEQIPVKPAEASGQGITHEELNALLRSVGAEELDTGGFSSFRQGIEDAATKAKQDPMYGKTLLTELKASDRPPSNTEIFSLAVEKQRLTNELNAVQSERAKLAEIQNEAFREQRASELRAREEQIKNDIEETARAIGKNTSKAGAALGATRVLTNEDYSYAGITQRIMAATEGKALSPKARKVAQELADEIKVNREQAKAVIVKRKAGMQDGYKAKFASNIYKKLEKAGMEAEKRIIERMGRARSGISPEEIADHVTHAAWLIAKGMKNAAELAAYYKQKWGADISKYADEIWSKAKSAVDADEAAEYESLLARKIKAAEAKIEKLSEKVEAGDTSTPQKKANRPSVKQLEVLEQEIDDLNNQLSAMRRKERTVKDLTEQIKAKEEALKTGDIGSVGKSHNYPQIDEIEVLRRKRDELNKDVKRILVIKDRVRSLTEQTQVIKDKIANKDFSTGGIQKDRPQVKEIEQALQERDEARKEWLELRRETNKKTDVEKEIALLDRRIASVKKQIQDRAPFSKEQNKQRPTSPEIEARRKELEQLEYERQNLRDELQSPKEYVPKEQRSLDAQEYAKQLDKYIAKLEAQIKDRAPFTPDKKIKPISKEIDEKLKLIEKLKYERQNLRDELQSPKEYVPKEQRSLDARKEFRSKRIAELEKALDEGKTPAPKEKPTKLEDDEIADLNAYYEMLKDRVEALADVEAYNAKGLAGKTVAQIGAAYDTTRNMSATGEFSVLLKQALPATLSSPIRTFKTYVDKMLRGTIAMSHDRLVVENKKMLATPEARQFMANGGFLSDIGGHSRNMDEQYIVNQFAQNTPGLKQAGAISQRIGEASAFFMNQVRIDMWKAGLIGADPSAYKNLARSINDLLGRSSLGRAEALAPVLNRAFFSARFWASTIKNITGMPLIQGKGVRPYIAKIYLRAFTTALTATAGLYAFMVAKHGEDNVEITPFGDVNVMLPSGNKKSYSLISSLASSAKFVSKIVREGLEAAGIMDEPKRKGPFDKDAWQMGGEYVRTKLHPGAQLATTWLTGKDAVGNEVNRKELWKQAPFYPITYKDIYDAAREDDLPEGVVDFLALMHGAKVNTYEPRKKKIHPPSWK